MKQKPGNYLQIIWICCMSGFIHAKPISKVTIVTESLPPFQYQENNKIKGTAYEHVKQILNCAKLEGDYVFLPWNQAYDYALIHKNTLIFSMARLKNREKHFIWLEVIGHTDDYLFKLKSRKDINVRKISDILNYRLGLQKDDFIIPLIKNKLYPLKPNIVYYQTHHQKFKMLLNDRFDLMEEESEVFKFKKQKKEFGYDQLEKLIPLISPVPFYLAINENSNISLINQLKKCTPIQLN